MKYSPKKIERYRRQRYISQLDKIGKNLFKMFRDKSVKSKEFTRRFSKLMDVLNSIESIRLDSEHLRESERYYKRLYSKLLSSNNFDDQFLDEIRQQEMSNLNRLQKLKNRASYRRDKHKKFREI